MAEPTERVAVTSSRRRVGFFAHQFAEYVVAIAFVAIGLHMSGGPEVVLSATGGAFILLNVVSSGRLGAFALLGRRAHHIGDLAIASLLFISPVFGFVRHPISGVVVGELLALFVLWVERSTRYEEAGRGSRVVEAFLAPRRDEGQERSSRSSPPWDSLARRVGLAAGITQRVAREHRKAWWERSR